MIEEILTKDFAKQCVDKKTKFYYAYLAIGMVFAIYPTYIGSEKNITVTLISLAIPFILAFIVIKLSIVFHIKSMTGTTYNLNDKQLTVISKHDSYKIPISEITKVKENKNGLTVKSHVETIQIPNNLLKFNEFKSELKKY
jgi:ABC-type transport system involved in multi-copper enzyme maturation permease subunit